MAPRAQISQEAFDAAVQENVEEFGMDEEEARADAVHTFKLQGADLSGIIIHGGEHHPVLVAMQRLEQDLNNAEMLEQALENLNLACTAAEDVCIAVKHGAVKKCVSACQHSLSRRSSLCAALRTLDHLLADEHAKVEFADCGGPELIVQALALGEDGEDDAYLSGLAWNVVGSAASGNEGVKDAFMHLKVEESLVDFIRRPGLKSGVLNGACGAFRALVSADDDSVPASNAFRNARTIVKAGGVEAVLNLSCASRSDQALLATLCATLKALAVNEEACKLIAAASGVESVLQFMNDSVKTGNKYLARNTCSLLAQLAGSDANKDAIVSQGGCQTLISLASYFAPEPLVIQEVIFALASLTLRSPDNASKALDAGAVDLAVEMMNEHPQSPGIHRQACQMLRNMAVRNPESRPIMLEKGVEKLIRATKVRHPSCRDTASAALRDLGLDNYND